MRTIGLTPETAGEKESILSSNEVDLIREAEDMINHLRSMGGMFENEIMTHVRNEIGVLSRGMKNINLDKVLEEAVKNVDESS